MTTEVQDALAGITELKNRVYRGIMPSDGDSLHNPPYYVVYSATTWEDFHADDRTLGLKTYVYMDLWSDGDPTEIKEKIRKAMYGAGFFMYEETDKGYNQPAYSTGTKRNAVNWTWVWREDVDYGSDDAGV